MRAVSLCFHDAVTGADFDASGFPGSSPAAYKMRVDEMDRHFEAIESARADKPSKVEDFPGSDDDRKCPLFLTFDDGGVSSATHIADLLEKRGWFGHFFITASRVDTRAFVSREQVRELRRRGHIVGSHSWSHPTRMAYCEWKQMQEEWTRSVGFLSDLLGQRVETASVPGGYYSAHVAEAAAEAGIRFLFNSEPQKRVSQVQGCLVLGRYGLLRGMPPVFAAQLAAANLSRLQLRQYLFWNTKKVLKRIGGRGYLALRQVLLRHRR